MPDWQWVQKRFEKLGLHRKHDSGLNIWICEVTGPRKSRKLHGYLLIDANWLFDAVPPNNPYLRVTQRDLSMESYVAVRYGRVRLGRLAASQVSSTKSARCATLILGNRDTA